MLFPSSCPPNYQKKNAPYPPSPLSDSPRAKGCLASSHFQSFLPLTLSALFSSLRKTQSASLSKNPPHSSLVFFPFSVFLQALCYPACFSRMSLQALENSMPLPPPKAPGSSPQNLFFFFSQILFQYPLLPLQPSLPKKQPPPGDAPPLTDSERPLHILLQVSPPDSSSKSNI